MSSLVWRVGGWRTEGKESATCVRKRLAVWQLMFCFEAIFTSCFSFSRHMQIQKSQEKKKKENQSRLPSTPLFFKSSYKHSPERKQREVGRRRGVLTLLHITELGCVGKDMSQASTAPPGEVKLESRLGVDRSCSL